MRSSVAAHARMKSPFGSGELKAAAKIALKASDRPREYEEAAYSCAKSTQRCRALRQLDVEVDKLDHQGREKKQRGRQL